MYKKFKIGAIGEVLWDIYPEKKFLGGAVFNFIHHLVQLEHDALLFTRIGDDREGREMIKAVKSLGHNTDYYQIDKKNPSGFVKVVLDENKMPTFFKAENASYYFLEYDDRFDQVGKELDAFLFGTFTQTTPEVVSVTDKYIERSGAALKVFDVNFRWWDERIKRLLLNSLPCTDVLKMNEEEYRRVCPVVHLDPADYKNSLLELAGKYEMKIVCVTLGEDGCLLTNGTQLSYCPGYKVNVLDTTGAGDAFVAAMTLSVLERKSISEIGQVSNRLAGFIACREGASPSYNKEKIRIFSEDKSELNIREEFGIYI